SYMFKNCNLKQDDIIGACDSVLLGGNLNLYFPGRHYTNLTKEEFLALRDNLENEYIYLNKKDNITV
ncbi:MAG: hypothetical protein MJ149_00450, partial [Clostridia bacterium]|nr:hypothetical protein [Clostridia bacterium]